MIAKVVHLYYPVSIFFYTPLLMFCSFSHVGPVSRLIIYYDTFLDCIFSFSFCEQKIPGASRV